jgi:2-oxoglutarate dehydrogenase E1 component
MSRATVASVMNREIIEATYHQWRLDPSSVDPSWSYFFEGFEAGLAAMGDSASQPVAALVSKPSQPASEDGRDARDHLGISRLIHRYRDLGHLVADLNPLQPAPDKDSPLLAVEQFNLSNEDLDRQFDCSEFYGMERASLRELLDVLRETYCRTIGVEFTHLQDPEMRRWLAQRMEVGRNRGEFTKERRILVLSQLLAAERFEDFLHRKFIGQKRFSLEGGEALVPLLDSFIAACPGMGVGEVVLGMAHRGRLNVLVNTLGKPFEEVFAEFEENYDPSTMGGDGDVKYHLGYSNDRVYKNGKVHLTLTPNPSHLEAVNPVVEGRVRAKQMRITDRERKKVLPLLIHGDAAFAGQGIVAETLNLSGLPGYTTGGTVHLVINNQIGFTTVPADARSTFHCTDMAKIIQAPIFHVNGDDPEACAYLAELALEFRQTFRRDVVIDIVCYRKYGHNEGDEPAFTQPVMYGKIRSRLTPPKLYASRLESSGVIDSELLGKLSEEVEAKLQAALDKERGGVMHYKGMPGFEGTWKGMTNRFSYEPALTSLSLEALEKVAVGVSRFPETFQPNPKVRDLLAGRTKAILEDKPFDWGAGEMYAFGSLVLEGTRIRISGQDCRRGTFSHRHAVLYDLRDGHSFCPLEHLSSDQERFKVYDSLLSEAAVLGFEFGYSMDAPDSLVIWEAQFGDFVNGAQSIIDQFIVASESKWKRDSGLVMLLPHGYEGQGPEHSSARLERFLQLCAEDNIQVAYPTSPAQYFHLLRRQVKRNFRKPIVVMSPKSLLRHKLCTSSRADLLNGGFREVLDDPKQVDPSRVRRLLICSGKVFYDLHEERERRNLDDVAILRVEQIYPLHEELLASLLGKYRHAATVAWVQEESQNMGAWSFIEPRLRTMGVSIQYVGRDASASPATGVKKVHEKEQKELVEQALTGSLTHLVRANFPKAKSGDTGGTQRELAGAKAH